MLDLARYEDGVCHGCGFHSSLTGDLSNHFTPEDTFCNVCRGVAKYERLQAAQDQRQLEALGEKPNPLAPRNADGRRTNVRMTTEAQRAIRS